MKASQSKNMVCNICGKTKARSMMMPAALVRGAVADQIKTVYPAQPGLILSGGRAGSGYHDEPEPGGSQRPLAVPA